MKRFLKAIFAVFTPLRIAITVAAVAFFWFLLFGDQGIYHLNRLSLMKKKLTNQRETLKTDIERLSQEKELLRDPKNLERVIRKDLGYVRPGEVIYKERPDEEQRP